MCPVACTLLGRVTCPWLSHQILSIYPWLSHYILSPTVANSLSHSILWNFTLLGHSLIHSFMPSSFHHVFFECLLCARLLYFQDPGVSTRPMPGQSEHSLFLATGMVTDGQVTQVIPLRLKSKTPSGTFMYFPLELPNSRYQPGAAGDHSWIVGR